MKPRLVVAALALIVLLICIGSMRLDSATADEGAHIASGLIKLKLGWMGFFPEQPPLMNSLSALPLLTYRIPSQWREAGSHWNVGYLLLYRSGYDPARILFLARLPTIALFLALCFTVYWFVATHSNAWWGVFAFALTAFCPNLIAHGRLATVDMAATFFMFAAVALWIDSRRPIAVGVLVACAILSKTSALLLGPYFVVLFLFKRQWRNAIIAILAALVVFEGVYLIETSSAYLTSVGESRTPLMPFVEYAKHVKAIQRWFVTGHEHPQFLLGQFSDKGWPYYYFVAWLLKVPLGAQLLLIGSIVLTIRRRHPAAVACLGFVLLFFAASTTSKIDLGIRYILPVFPFAYAGIAIALANANVNRTLTGVLLACHIASSLFAYPGYISYFNEIIGSRRNADRFLIDSNLDWGQDLHRLKLWCDAHHVDSIRIDYFGGGSVEHEFGSRAQIWPAPRPQPLPRGWFALSRHLYRARNREAPIDYDTYLEGSRAKYVDTIGGSIYVFVVE